MGWNVGNIPDQAGRTVLITGANSGLGEQATLALSRAGATVIMACRNLDTAAQVAAAAGPRARVESLDLTSLASVRALVERVGEIDVLINNAGLMAPPLRRTVEGFELQFGTNHLGHFALTGGLLPKIRERIVTVSSFMHLAGRINLEDPNYEHRRYERWTAYGQSKLANLLFARELDSRLRGAGSAVRSYAAHPGYARTGLQSHTESVLDGFMAVGNRIVAQSAAEGALPELFAATSPDAQGGGFYGPRFVMRGAPIRATSSRASKNPRTAAALWELSERLTGVSYL